MNLRPWAAPTAVGVAIAAAAGGAVLVARSSSGSHLGSAPHKLALASYAGQRNAMGAPVSDSSSPSSYTLEGTLSDQKPADGRVRRPSRGSADAAAKLASALGLNGKPTAIKGGWALRGPDNTVLLLRADGSWSWAMDCDVEKPIFDENTDVGCDMAESLADPAPPGPSVADTERTARPVFAALDLDGAVRATQGQDTESWATVEPVAGGSTTLQVSRDLKVVGGNGWLSGSTEGDAYPLISAADAFEALKAMPLIHDDMCRVRTDGKPGCEEPAPPVVVGAHLGLMLDRDREGALLVPAWLFELKGSTDTVPWVAIDPAYLEPMDGDIDPGFTGGGSGSSDGSTGSGGAPTSITPVPPNSSPGTDPGSGGTEPAPPAPNSTRNGAPDTPADNQSLQSYSLDGDSTLVGYKELGACQGMTLSVKEDESSVYVVVQVTEHSVPYGFDCSKTNLSSATVTLAAPLGTRVVRNTDGSEVSRRK